ncbi:extracellular solute-binding protein [Microbacterium sp. ET2]|uniref:ABC transporter substrate-binding protein n=1 Tax=Microbacterium albipurpureum TaxID=3050384 RepID=UPI00259C84B5|nr:extracellular solute-binding protein [Microbacterium sp. ET2 (Ac-2212)]WJL96906.1 extracellular solute-binding protein [Microbacterium sp. ET2 (Ac-2212)]
MKQQLRYLAVATAASATILGLSACGGGSGGEAAAPEATGEVAGEIQYSWWGGPARNEKTQAVIDLYQEANPDVTVNGTTAEFAAYFETASVQAAGDNLPCVPQMQNRLMADYADRGALRPLDDLVENGTIDVSAIPESVLDSGRGSDGQLYMIPYGAAFGSLLVNTTMVEDAGLPLPPEEYDWEWLAGWFGDVTEATGAPATGIVGNQQDVLEAWLRSHDADFYDEGSVGFTAEDVEAFWDYSLDLQENGYSISAERASETTGLPLEQNDFSQGTQATVFWPANGLGTAQATIDQVAPGNVLQAFPLPTGPSGNGSAFWLSGLSISANCDNVATAADFIDFFVNDEEAALVYASDNGANTQTENLQALLDSPDTSEAKRAELELYQTLADAGVAPTVYGTGYATLFQQAVTRYYQQVSFDQLSVEEAAEQFTTEAQDTIG